jgi:type I restriction enzyme S subunit
MAAKCAYDIKLGKMLQTSPVAPTDQEVPYLKSASIQWAGVRADPSNRMWASRSDVLSLEIRTGDLLVCEGGDVGRCAIYRGPSGYIFQNSVHRVRARTGSDVRFFRYILEALHASGWLDVLCNKATIRHFTGDKLGALEVPSPSLEDQCRIADFLDVETARIDALKAARGKMRELLVLRRKRLVEAVLGLVRDGNDKNMVPLKYLVEKITVGIVITPARWYVESGGVPALRGLNVRPGVIDTSDLVKISDLGHAENFKSRLEVGDVVVVRTGQAGAAAMVPQDFAGANCIDLILVRPGNQISPRYLEYVLNSSYASGQVAENSVGSIQAHFNVGAMKQLPIPSIPIDRQVEIVAELDEAMAHLESLEEKLDDQDRLLAERRQALITAAVTGQLDVTTARPTYDRDL